MVPEISVEELAARLRSTDAFVVMDVREPWELTWARLHDARLVTSPMSELAQRGVAALPPPVQDKAAEIYVMCHHGVRSADVTRWLASQGWTNVHSVAGGIDAYARKVDPTVGSY